MFASLYRFLTPRIVLRFGLLMLTLCLLLPAHTAFAQNLKVGYVDLQQALNKVDDGKTAKARLKKDFDAKQKELNSQQEQVKKLKEQIESQPMLSEDAKRGKVMEMQKKMYELQQLYVALQGDLAKAEAKATKDIFDKMGKIIEGIAKEKGYDLVLERTESAILFAKEGMDLTDELIKRYNKKY